MVDDFETSKLITRIDFGVFYEHFYDQTPKLCDIIEDKRRFLLLDEFVHAYGKILVKTGVDIFCSLCGWSPSISL